MENEHSAEIERNSNLVNQPVVELFTSPLLSNRIRAAQARPVATYPTGVFEKSANKEEAGVIMQNLKLMQADIHGQNTEN